MPFARAPNLKATGSSFSLLDLIPGYSQAQSVEALIAEVSDGAMWRSLGWLILGLWLMWAGVLGWWRQSSANRSLEDAAAAVTIGRNPLPDLSSKGKVSVAGHQAPVIPVLLILAGAYLAWFAIRYWRDQQTTWPADPVKDVLRGLGLPKPRRSPAAATRVASPQVAAGPAATGTGAPAGIAGGIGQATGDAIARDAASYAGKVPYKWGGASPATGWDCSGLVNWVLCHDMGLDIPGARGGNFDGRTHGPNVAEWLAWAAGVDVVRIG
jgi:hypothetical protein